MLTIGVSADFHTLSRSVVEPVERALAAAPGYVQYRWFEATGEDAAGPYVSANDIAGLDGAVLLAYRFAESSLTEESTLAVIGRWGVGYDRLDVPTLTRHGCLLAITPDGVRRPVAEAIVTLLLALAKQLMPRAAVVASGDWSLRNATLSYGLEGKVVGSVGMGNIGTDLFRLLAPFGFARMLAHDPYVSPEAAAEIGVELVGLEELLAESDFVALNCPLNAETHHLMNRERLARMKSTAYLINTARGPVVDQEALVEALQRGVIAGAGLDVQDPEPLPLPHPLTELDNVILTPHTLAWTDQLYELNGTGAVDNVLAVLRGDIPEPTVNRDVLDSPRFQASLTRFRAAAAA